MVIGQCEGPTFYEVAFHEIVQIAHVIKHSRPPGNMIVRWWVYRSKEDFDSECKRATTAV